MPARVATKVALLVQQHDDVVARWTLGDRMNVIHSMPDCSLFCSHRTLNDRRHRMILISLINETILKIIKRS